MLTSGGDPAELHQDGFNEPMFMYRGAEVCSAQRAEGREYLSATFSSLGGKCYREDRARLSSEMQSQGTRQKSHKLQPGKH